MRRIQFREDLFSRLNVIPIQVPPLRARISDLPLLAQHFLDGFSRSRHKAHKRLSPAALDLLRQYPWPGNVRELENLMERLVILTEGEIIETADLPEKFQGLTSFRPEKPEDFPVPGLGLNDPEQAYERNLILAALRQANWVKSQAARLLRLKRTTLLEKMKKQSIPASPDLPPFPERFPKN